MFGQLKTAKTEPTIHVFLKKVLKPTDHGYYGSVTTPIKIT